MDVNWNESTASSYSDECRQVPSARLQILLPSEMFQDTLQLQKRLLEIFNHMLHRRNTKVTKPLFNRAPYSRSKSKRKEKKQQQQDSFVFNVSPVPFSVFLFVCAGSLVLLFHLSEKEGPLQRPSHFSSSPSSSSLFPFLT